MTALLALLTWGVTAVAISLLGWPLVRAFGLNRATTFRAAMWSGLLLGTMAVLFLGVLTPLGSAQAAVGVGVLLLICGSVSWMLRRRSMGAHVEKSDVGLSLTPVRILALVAIWASVIYLAIAVAGPITNYDTGLYHFGAISYAHDYATVPGLANLFSPFGYSNSFFPLAAFLGNGPWNGEGFRLINGLFVCLFALDVTLRILRQRITVGTYVLLVCTGVALIPLVALSDFWVISPSSDPAVMILTFISLGYLTDAIHSKSAFGIDALVAIAAAVLAVSMRPLMAFFAITLLLVLLVFGRKLGKSMNGQARSGRNSWAALLLITLAVAVVQAFRDYRLSGWLEYPLAFFSFDVPWKAADPTESQLSTLGFARDPEHMHEVTHGWEWIPSWLSRLPSQWEFAIICALILLAIVVWALVRTKDRRLLLAPAVLSAAPAAITTFVWFLFTPPSFRFAWGPIFGLLAVLIGWGLFGISALEARVISWRRRIPGLLLVFGSIAVLGVVGYSGIIRLDLSNAVENHVWTLGPVRIPYSVSPMLLPKVSINTLESGLTIQSPIPSDQCWARYPLCSPQAPATLRLQGSGLQSGFMAK